MKNVVLVTLMFSLLGCSTTQYQYSQRTGEKWHKPLSESHTTLFGASYKGRTEMELLNLECGSPAWSPGAIKITLEDGSSKIYECEDVRNGKL